MTRRSKLKQIKKLRAFRDFMLRKEDMQEMENWIMQMGVRQLDIQYNYSVYVNINMEDNQHFFTTAFWGKDALCEAGMKIYEYLIGKIYPTCVKVF
jgi:hypothetical protein